MMIKPIALLDVDGVLIDFLTPALAIASQISGKTFTINDLTSWDIFDTVGKEYEEACYNEYKKEGFCYDLKPYPGAVEAIDRLRERADLYIVTSPMSGRNWVHERTEALKKHFNISRNRIIFTSVKHLVSGHVFVDDRAEHARRWKAVNQGAAVIWEQPYNKNDVSRGAIRTNDWDYVVQEVENFYEVLNWPRF
jgi:5'(3')-deoxyribonucleotidase